MKKLIPFLLLLTSPLWADSPEARSVDLAGRVAPALEVYQANVKTYTWSLKNNGAAVNLTNATPFMYWAASNRASAVATAICTVISTTGGTFTAAWSSSSLNSNGAFVYGVGWSSNGVTTARQGDFLITPDPYATGAGALTNTWPLNLSLYGPFTGDSSGWPFLGTNTVAARITVSDTNAWWTAAGGGITAITASGGVVEVHGAGASRVIGVTTAAVQAAANPLLTGIASTQQTTVTWLGLVDGSGVVTRTMAQGLTTTQQVHTTQTVATAVHGMGSIAGSNNTAYYHASNPSGYLTAESDPKFAAASNDYLRLSQTGGIYVATTGAAVQASRVWTNGLVGTELDPVWTTESNRFIGVTADRKLQSANNEFTVLWNWARLIDTNGVNSLNWHNRVGYDNTGGTTINWQASQLWYGDAPSLNWSTFEMTGGWTIGGTNVIAEIGGKAPSNCTNGLESITGAASKYVPLTATNGMGYCDPFGTPTSTGMVWTGYVWPGTNTIKRYNYSTLAGTVTFSLCSRYVTNSQVNYRTDAANLTASTTSTVTAVSLGLPPEYIIGVNVLAATGTNGFSLGLNIIPQ